MDVSIIIVSYNTRELVKACLNSLYKNTSSLAFEVIVVDNNSQDRISEMLNEEFKEVKFLALPNNIGFGRANNEGIKIAKGRNIFLLNPDTLLLNNAVKILSDFLDARRDVAICGGNLYRGDLSPAHSYMMYLPSLKGELNEMLFGRLFREKHGATLEFNHGDSPLEVGYITGADMMIRQDVLDEVGLFDADFFMYFEETELTWRIKKRGYKVMNVPSAKIIHLEGQSITLKERREQMYLSSRRLYYQKIYNSALKRWGCHVMYGIKSLLQILYFTCYRVDKQQAKLWQFRYKHF